MHVIFFYEYQCLLLLKESASNLDEVLKERDDLSETCADLKQQMAQVKESSLLTMVLYKQYAAQLNFTNSTSTLLSSSAFESSQHKIKQETEKLLPLCSFYVTMKRKHK